MGGEMQHAPLDLDDRSIGFNEAPRHHLDWAAVVAKLEEMIARKVLALVMPSEGRRRHADHMRLPCRTGHRVEPAAMIVPVEDEFRALGL